MAHAQHRGLEPHTLYSPLQSAKLFQINDLISSPPCQRGVSEPQYVVEMRYRRKLLLPNVTRMEQAGGTVDAGRAAQTHVRPRSPRSQADRQDRQGHL